MYPLKAELRIFLGYSSVSKGYRVYNVHRKKLWISRDVIVNDASYWNLNDHEPKLHSNLPS